MAFIIYNNYYNVVRRDLHRGDHGNATFNYEFCIVHQWTNLPSIALYIITPAFCFIFSSSLSLLKNSLKILSLSTQHYNCVVLSTLLTYFLKYHTFYTYHTYHILMYYIVFLPKFVSFLNKKVTLISVEYTKISEIHIHVFKLHIGYM